MESERKFRYVSIENCKILGRGSHGIVYRLNDEQILKVYTDNSTFSAIDRERLYGKNVFLDDIPSAITFDTVVTEHGIGVIFELIDGIPMGTYMNLHPDKMDSLIEKYAALLKKIHNTKANTDVFGNSKDILIRAFENTSEKFFNSAQKESLIRIVNSIPDKFTYVHNDFHPQNIMIGSDGNMMVIDMAEMSYGSGIFDLGSLYMTLVFSGLLSDKLCKEITGLSSKQAKYVWKGLIRNYFNTQDENLIKEVERQCVVMKNLRLANLISTTNTFSFPALIADSLWTKHFLIRRESDCKRILAKDLCPFCCKEEV